MLPLFISSHFPAFESAQALRSSNYNFKDPQAGKDVYDRRIATVKSHVRRNITEGHDIKSASDMAEGLHRFLWPVTGCQASILSLRLKSQARP